MTVEIITYLIAATLGIMFASGTYLVLRRDIVRVVWGLVLMSQAANVYLVTMGGIGGAAPIIEGDNGYTDPLVQALVLTAIVIGFGVTAFALVLTYRVYQEHGSIDLAEFGRNWRKLRSGGVEIEVDGGVQVEEDEVEVESAEGDEVEVESAEGDEVEVEEAGREEIGGENAERGDIGREGVEREEKDDTDRKEGVE